jgi:hemolysin III
MDALETRENLANAVSHGIGLAASLVALPFLLVMAVRDGDAWTIAGAGVFGVTMVTLYLASTLYHAFPEGRARMLLRRFDHSAIFLFIAGTYTPFVLGPLRGSVGWILFGAVWGTAVAGVVLKVAGRLKSRVASVALYATMGWVIVAAARELWLRVPPAGIFWLVAGGVCYTVGIPFYAASRMRYHHAAWHLFVMAGSACHFCAILGYAR